MILWKTNLGQEIIVSEMSTKHIQNCINCIKGIGGQKIPNPHVGLSHKEWLKIFEQELNNREPKQIIYECW